MSAKTGYKYIVVVLVFLLLSVIATAQEIPDFEPYLTKNGVNKDPINLIFVGDLESTLQAFNEAFPGAYRPTWSGLNKMTITVEGQSVAESAQLSVSTIGQVPIVTELADAFGVRLHIRFFEASDVTFASAHYDISSGNIGCLLVLPNHVGLLFNTARDNVAAVIGNSGDSINNGATDSLTQCDGQQSSGDGGVAVVSPEVNQSLLPIPGVWQANVIAGQYENPDIDWCWVSWSSSEYTIQIWFGEDGLLMGRYRETASGVYVFGDFESEGWDEAFYVLSPSKMWSRERIMEDNNPECVTPIITEYELITPAN